MNGKQNLEEKKSLKQYKNQSHIKESIRNVISFLVFGGISHGQSAVLSSAVQDILTGTILPTTTLQLAKSVPRVIVTIVYPRFVSYIPPVLRVLLATVATATGILLVVYAGRTQVKLIGVALFSTGFGAADVALTGLGAYFHPITMAAYQSGNGIFSVSIPLVYIGMTTWLHISPGEALLFVASLSSLNLVFYFCMDRSVLFGNKEMIRKLHYSQLNSENEEEMEQTLKIPAWESKSEKEENEKEYEEVFSYEIENNDKKMGDVLKREDLFSKREKNEEEINKTRYQALASILPYILFLFFEYLLADLIINSIVTVLAFPNAPFSQRDHFVYYYLILVSFLFISRSYLTLFMWLCPAHSNRMVIKNLLVFSSFVLFLAICLVFLFCAAWFRFLSNVGAVLVIISAVGTVAGIIDSNALCSIKIRGDPKNKEFLLGQASLA